MKKNNSLKEKVQASLEKEIKSKFLCLLYKEDIEILQDDFNGDNWTGFKEVSLSFEPIAITVEEPDPWPPLYPSEHITEIDNIRIENPVDYIGVDIHLVIVIYYTGGTFGKSYGEHHIALATTSRIEAESYRKLIEDDNENYIETRYNRDPKNKAKKHVSLLKERYIPWQGYFEGLERVEIFSTKVVSNKEIDKNE